jgi:hypothetical protein
MNVSTNEIDESLARFILSPWRKQLRGCNRVTQFEAFRSSPLYQQTQHRHRVHTLANATRLKIAALESLGKTFATCCYSTEHKVNNGPTLKLKASRGSLCSGSPVSCEFITRYQCVVINSSSCDVIRAVRLFIEVFPSLAEAHKRQWRLRFALFSALFLHNSRLWFFRLFRPFDRRVGCPLDRETARELKDIIR